VTRAVLGTRPIRAAGLVAAALTLAGTAHALPPAPPDWEVTLLGYGWASSISADVEAGGVTTSEDIGFLDLLGHLDWAIEGGAEIRYKRVLLLLDGIGNQLSDSQKSDSITRMRDTVFGPADLTLGPAKVKVRTTLWIVGAQLGVRALSLPLSKLFSSLPDEDPRRLDVDLFTGIRYWNDQNRLNTRVSPATGSVNGNPIDVSGIDLPDFGSGRLDLPGRLLRGGDHQFTETVDWVDPVWGLRIRGDVTEHLSVVLMGDVGGFSIGNGSSLTWQAMGGLRWRFGRHWSVVGGYRALAVDRSNALESAMLYGPELGVAYSF